MSCNRFRLSLASCSCSQFQISISAFDAFRYFISICNALVNPIYPSIKFADRRRKKWRRCDWMFVWRQRLEDQRNLWLPLTFSIEDMKISGKFVNDVMAMNLRRKTNFENAKKFTTKLWILKLTTQSLRFYKFFHHMTESLNLPQNKS